MIPSNPFHDSVTDLKPSDLVKKYILVNLKSHKPKTKAKVEDPAHWILDIVPYYHNQQQYPDIKTNCEKIDFGVAA